MKNFKSQFTGFSQESIEFLKDISSNNNKIWFEDHKDLYQKHLLNPFKALVNDLTPTMLEIDNLFETRPAINKTISRIYRDIRFSKDKSPYKSRVWLTFKYPSKNWHNTPAYFFELNAETFIYGMGYFYAKPATMQNLREFIDKKPADFEKIIKPLQSSSNFELSGDKYKRLLREDLSKKISAWYQRKNIYLISENSNNRLLFSKQLVDKLCSDFKSLETIYNLFWTISTEEKK
jgi:uncharacterized protein (TIGR02453 family)